MYMVGHAAHAMTLAAGITRNGGEIAVERRSHRRRKKRLAIFRAENQVDDHERERLWQMLDRAFSPRGEMVQKTWAAGPGSN